MDNFGEKLLILTVLTAGLAGAYWYFLVYVPPQADGPIVLQPEAVEEPPEETGPIHPMVPPNSSAPTERTLVPLPALDDSDGYFLLAFLVTMWPKRFGPSADCRTDFSSMRWEMTVNIC